MNVFQILLRDPQFENSELPNSLTDAINTVRNSFQNMNYTLYTNTTLRKFIAENFEAHILKTYDNLKPYAYKSDLGRYCILAKTGGWYIDIGLKLLQSLHVNAEIDLILFSDRGCGSCAPWAIQNGLIYSKPENQIFYSAIDAICANYKNSYYGKSALDPTGPNLFGKAVACNEVNNNIYFGEFRPITADLSINNLMYISRTGQLIAQHKTSWLPGSEGGDLTALGLEGTNNYKELWANKDIYINT